MADALVIQEILRLFTANNGEVTPQMVVDEARPKHAPLHDHFEWDNKLAGEQWRIQQARVMLRTLRLPVMTSGGETRMVPLGINITSEVDGDDRFYHLTSEILNDSQQSLRAALGALHRCESILRNFPHPLTDEACRTITSIVSRAERLAAE